MKKSTFVGNVAVWGVLLVVCVAFQVWYRGASIEESQALMETSTLAQVAIMVSGPLLVFAAGAALGALVVWLRKVSLGRGARLAFRVLGWGFLALLVIVAVGVTLPAQAQAALGGLLLVPAVIVTFLSLAMSPVVALLGFCYAMGLAGVNTEKRGPFAKFLPDDHFE